MSIATESMRNGIADDYGARAGLLSVHNGDPGTGGANEIGGGGYTRQVPSWSSPSASQIQATVTFDLPATTMTHVGVWDATGTVFLDSAVLPSPVVIPAPGQRNVTATATVT